MLFFEFKQINNDIDIKFAHLRTTMPSKLITIRWRPKLMKIEIEKPKSLFLKWGINFFLN